MHRIHGFAVKVKSAYTQPIIQLVHVLSAFSAYRIWRHYQLTSIKYLWEWSYSYTMLLCCTTKKLVMCTWQY